MINIIGRQRICHHGCMSVCKISRAVAYEQKTEVNRNT